MRESGVPWLALFAVLGLSGSVRAADAPAVTRETCASCHDKETEAFARGSHGRAIARRGKDLLETSCVACHGFGAAHVADPSKGNIRRLPPPEACAGCHAASGRMSLLVPAHARPGVTCLDCHASGHSKAAAEPLLKAPATALCGRCHGSEAASFALPYAHREGTRPLACTACHGIHANGERGRQALLGKGATCVECHTEKAGPWVFPHAPRFTDGCMSCHRPHGATEPRLLTRHRTRDLCLECHANVSAFHDLSKPRFQNCVTCHAAIHGSNRDPNLLDE